MCVSTWINDNVMTEWLDNNDIIFNKNSKFTIFLKSFHGSPLFTLDELKICAKCKECFMLKHK